MLPRLETLPWQGHTLAFRQAGQGQPLFLIHGLGGTSASWENQFDTLASKARVIAWDCPGYGGSDAILPNADSYANAAAALLKALHTEAVSVVGHSMGGVVAARLAGLHPQVVASVVLSCTHVGGKQTANAPLPASYAQRLDVLRSTPKEEYARARAKGMSAPNASEGVLAFLANIVQETPLVGLENAIRMLVEADNSPSLKQLRMPVTVIKAELDQVVSAERVDELADCVAHAKRVVLKGVGHAPYVEDIPAFNAVLLAALQLAAQ